MQTGKALEDTKRIATIILTECTYPQEEARSMLITSNLVPSIFNIKWNPQSKS